VRAGRGVSPGVEGMRITPEQITAVAARFRQVGEQLHDAGQRAHTQLTELEAPWGGDEQGSAFAAHYLPAAQNAIRLVELLADACTGIATTLAANAARTQAGEDATRTTFTTPSQTPPPARPAGPPPYGSAGV
jgi:uncharacterized protein YukE